MLTKKKALVSWKLKKNILFLFTFLKLLLILQHLRGILNTQLKNTQNLHHKDNSISSYIIPNEKEKVIISILS